MFSNNYYPSHIEVLNGLLCSLKYERFKLSSEQSSALLAVQSSTHEVEACFNIAVRKIFYFTEFCLVGHKRDGKYFDFILLHERSK